VAGLTAPNHGEIWIGGKNATHMPPHLRDIGMMFQSYALFPHMSVFENIAFPLRMRKMSQKQISDDVGRVLDLVRLPHVADRLPAQLSGGQQQRIALARAIVYRPSIVLMDEPLGALDKKLRQQMQFEIKRIHKETGITLLWVTHDQEEALLLSDRICLMSEGRIAQIGTPQEIYARPSNEFVADFIGESNFLKAKVLKADSREITVDVMGTNMAFPSRIDFPATEVATLALRPEDIIVDSRPAAAAGLPATVCEVVFLGEAVKYFLRLADGQMLTAKMLRRHHNAGVCAGSTVVVHWPPDACIPV
jgi:ABC-type Fe3+/spermidine/putrescine transport system ATPase subunit